MYVGYTLVVFNRKSFTFAMPAIIASVGLDKDDAGEMPSTCISVWLTFAKTYVLNYSFKVKPKLNLDPKVWF